MIGWGFGRLARVLAGIVGGGVGGLVALLGVAAIGEGLDILGKNLGTEMETEKT